MSILVTGGCGLVGSTLTRALVKEGEEVWVFDKWIATSRLSQIEGKVRIIQGDLANFSHILEAVKACSPRTIFHLGGMLSLPSHADPQSSFFANVAGTFHVLEAARIFEVPKVLFTSTTATYGLDIKGTVIDDFTLQRPITMYGSTKVFGELLGRFYRSRYDLDFRAVRFPSVVGPGSKVAHISIYNAWAVEKAFYGEPYDIFVEPEIRCPILYFKDAARALIQLEASPREQIKTVCYLLAGIKPPISAAELVAEIKRHFPQAALNFRPDPMAMEYHQKCQGMTFDDSKAKEEWGWRVQYDLERTVADFYQELRSHPERYR
jgi:threonine 3-dehydrogenase